MSRHTKKEGFEAVVVERPGVVTADSILAILRNYFGVSWPKVSKQYFRFFNQQSK
jgi:hypothetical protein